MNTKNRHFSHNCQWLYTMKIHLSTEKMSRDSSFYFSFINFRFWSFQSSTVHHSVKLISSESFSIHPWGLSRRLGGTSEVGESTVFGRFHILLELGNHRTATTSCWYSRSRRWVIAADWRGAERRSMRGACQIWAVQVEEEEVVTLYKRRSRPGKPSLWLPYSATVFHQGITERVRVCCSSRIVAPLALPACLRLVAHTYTFHTTRIQRVYSLVIYTGYTFRFSTWSSSPETTRSC